MQTELGGEPFGLSIRCHFDYRNSSKKLALIIWHPLLRIVIHVITSNFGECGIYLCSVVMTMRLRTDLDFVSVAKTSNRNLQLLGT